MPQRIVAATRELVAPAGAQLLDYLLPASPLAFVRNHEGLVGEGELLRLEASGPERMQQLAQQWRDLVQASEVQDSLNWSGTGLVAFGTVAFADESSSSSVLVVPKRLIGRRDDRWWITDFGLDALPAGASAVASLPLSHEQVTAATGVQFHEGVLSSSQFKNSVTGALAAIERGDLSKVVLARDISSAVSPDFDLGPVLHNLEDNYPNCWIYAVDGMFGASPELLVRVAHGQVSARVLAGTAGRGTDRGIDQAIAAALTRSAKNASEHKFAVDSMVDALKPFCSQVDADTEPFSLALPNVWHLASDVYGVLKQQYSVLDIAAALHPTAAVAGTPRKAALDFLKLNEPFDRGRYAGPVGWLGADGDGEWAIALRGAQLADGKLTAFAGCGIVAESEPEAELAETELKFAPIRQALA